MKTPEDVINRFINEENVKFNQEHDDWMIEAMEEYAKLYHESKVKKLNIPAVSGMLPLTKEHQCFERGHAFYLVCEIDNDRSKYGDHKCSRCGHVEPFQYDYGSW